MLIEAAIVFCLILVIGLVGLVLLYADLSDHTDEPKTGGAEPQGEFPWRGKLSLCCHSTYSPTDVMRRILGWHSTNYVEPAHLAWWNSPQGDPARDYNYTRQQGAQPTQLRNQLEPKSISSFVDKSKVFDLMLRDPTNAQYLPRSWLVGDFLAELDNGGDVTWPVLAKDPDASIQMGVWVLSSRKELEDLLAEQHTLRGNPRVVINQYITPPLLWYDEPRSPSVTTIASPDAGQGKKFHLRVFLILLVRAGVVYAWIPDFFKIMTAKKPFSFGDWHDKDIHMTGGSRTAREFWWQRDAAWHMRLPAEKLDEITTSAKKCMLAVAEQAATEVQSYPEARAGGYNLFGADILPDETGHCWFVEINRRPSWLAKNHDNRSVAIASMHMRFQAENIIRPIFGIGEPARLPDAVYAAKESGPLTPHLAYLREASSWEKSPGVWELRGNKDAATALRELALEARLLPAPSAKLTPVSQPPFSPPVGMTWTTTGIPRRSGICRPIAASGRGRNQRTPPASATDRQANCPLTAWVSPPDDPSAATSEDTLSEWIDSSLTFERLDTETAISRGVSLAYAEPGAMHYGFGKSFQSVRAIMKSALGGRDHLCDKTKLAATMKLVGGEKFLPRTWEFARGKGATFAESLIRAGAVPSFSAGDVYIVKQRGSSGQEGVFLAASKDAYLAALAKCEKTSGVVQEYLRWPLTSRGKKMHIRAYVAAYITGGVTRVYYASDVCKIMTAKDKYVTGDWENRDIHISGGDFTAEWLDWPLDADCEALDICSAQESIDAAMAALGRAAAETLYKYPEGLAGFHVFGVDIIIDAKVLHDEAHAAVTPPEDRMRAIILEVNDRPGLGMKDLNRQEYEQLSRRYLAWLEESCVGAHFCTTMSRIPLVAEPEAKPPRQDNVGHPGVGPLAQYVDLLRGGKSVSVVPSLHYDTSNSYELRVSDAIVGKLVRANRTDYYFVSNVATWWNDPDAVSSREILCGLALLSLAHSSEETTVVYNLIHRENDRVPRSWSGDSVATPTITGRGEDYPRTYLCVDRHYLTRQFLAWLLPGWKGLVKPIAGQPIGWVAAMTSTKSHAECPARLKSQLNSRELWDKVRFHGYANEFPEDVAETFEVGPECLTGDGSRCGLPDDAPWIVRANWAFAGSANRVVVTSQQLAEAYSQFSVKPEQFKNRSPARVIASRYIADPMLLPTGHKFHARVHIFVQRGAKLRTRAAILGTIYLMSSEEVYRQDSWDDHAVHDTHGRYRNNFRALLESLPGADQLREDTVAALSRIFKAMVPRLGLYEDAENAYELYGADIMYSSVGHPIVLEVNNNPGIKATPEIESAIHAEMLAEIASAVTECFDLPGPVTREVIPSLLADIYDGVRIIPRDSVCIDL